MTLADKNSESPSTHSAPNDEEDGEILETSSVSALPAKRRKCDSESSPDQKMDCSRSPKTLIRSSNIVWVDLEMTGLDPTKDTIMEIACIITDKHLNILGEGPNLVIHHPEKVLDQMSEWCVNQHGKTGLTEECRRSTIELKEAEKEVISFVKQYCPKGRCELAGNSVHCDQKFIERHMPDLYEWLHYRIIDVSSIRTIAGRLYPDFVSYYADKGPSNHRALDDIRSSIRELAFYRDTVFKSREAYSKDMQSMAKPKESFDELMSYFDGTPQRDGDMAGATVNTTFSAKPHPINVTVGGEKITLFGDNIPVLLMAESSNDGSGADGDFHLSQRLFVGGLKRPVEKWELESVFAPHGDVKDIWIAKDPPGYAFVEMVSPEAAKAAMEALHQTPALDSIIRIERTKPKGDKKNGAPRGRGVFRGRPRARGRGSGGGGGGGGDYHYGQHGSSYNDEEERPRLYVSGLSTEIETIATKEDMHTIFDSYGDVVDVWIAKNPPGFAFVEFSELYDAKRALLELDGTDTNHLGVKLAIEITHNSRAKRNRERREAAQARGMPAPPWGKPRGRPPPHSAMRPAKRGRGSGGGYGAGYGGYDPYYNDQGYYGGGEYDYYYQHDAPYSYSYGRGKRGRGVHHEPDSYGPYGAEPYETEPAELYSGRGRGSGVHGHKPDSGDVADPTKALAARVARATSGAPPAKRVPTDTLELHPEEKAAILRARARRAQLMAKTSALYDTELGMPPSDPYAVGAGAAQDPYTSAYAAPYEDPYAVAPSAGHYGDSRAGRTIADIPKRPSYL